MTRGRVWKNLSPEQKARWLDAITKARRAWWDGMSPSEREEYEKRRLAKEMAVLDNPNYAENLKKRLEKLRVKE